MVHRFYLEALWSVHKKRQNPVTSFMRLVPLCELLPKCSHRDQNLVPSSYDCPLCALFDNDDNNFTVKVKVLKGLVTGTTHHG